MHILGCVCGTVCRSAVAGADRCRAGVQCERLCVGREWRGGRGRSSPARGARVPNGPHSEELRSPGDSWDLRALARASGTTRTSRAGGGAGGKAGPRGPRGSHFRSGLGRGRRGRPSAPSSAAEGRRTEPCSRGRSPGISETRTVIWTRPSAFPGRDLLLYRMGTVSPSESVVTAIMRTY